MDIPDDEETDEQSMLEDLQLAAELGKTLLERNKELENCLKQHQNVIEDQTQEIEYLTKQTAALREVNDSRLRIYEQLEVSIQDLERTNQRLALDNSADKKHIKTLCLSIDSLETRFEELQRALDEANVQRDTLRRLQQNEASAVNPATGPACLSTATETDDRIAQAHAHAMHRSQEEGEVVRLLSQVQELRSQRAKEQRKVAELEEQLAGLLQENMGLEEQLALLQQKEEDMKSLQEEICTLEEVRQGQLCGRCLRTVDTRDQDELSLVLDHEEEDDVSIINSVISETHCNTVMLHAENSTIEDHHTNPYRILVEKYEALLQMQRHPVNSRHPIIPANNCLSLQEELQLSGEFNSFQSKDEVGSDQEGTENTVYRKGSVNGKGRQQNGGMPEKAFSTTPTDFSEAETSSSGFSDETSNKATQTEGHLPPGSFLCSIADGDDCRFSIYDDASPIASRFRKTPEYRQLFREIFAVLKRAAEAKDEGEQLPLLEDLTPVTEAPKVPPVTPAREELPASFPKDDHIVTKQEKKKTNTNDKKSKHNGVVEDTNSAHSDSVDKMAEMFPYSHPEVVQRKSLTNEDLLPQPERPETEETTAPKSPPKKDYLEYLSIGVGIKKKSSGRKNSPIKTLKSSVAERVERLESLPSQSSGISQTYTNRSYSRRRREQRSIDSPSQSPSPINVWGKREEQTVPPPRPTPPSYDKTWNFQPFVSSASQEVAKLRRLEKSYAEVLRFGPQKSSRSTGIVNHRK